jgi:uncharacterized protein (DUF427 family)
MVRATWNGVVVAESASTERVEGNHYFPRETVREEYLRPRDKHTICPWKGRASYFTLSVNGKENPDAAWYYPHPTPLAANIAGHVAFGRGVDVQED